MSDTDFASTDSASAADMPASVAPSAPPAMAPAPGGAERPIFIPEKFWDGAAGRIRIEDMAKSYRALEKKLGRTAETRRADDTGTSPHASEALLPRDAGPDRVPPGAHQTEPDEAAETARDDADAAGADADALDISVPASPGDYTTRV